VGFKSDIKQALKMNILHPDEAYSLRRHIGSFETFHEASKSLMYQEP
jgi:hypothetical protein